MEEKKMLLRIDGDLDFYLETIKEVYARGKTEYINDLIRKDKKEREDTGEFKKVLNALKTLDNFKNI